MRDEITRLAERVEQLATDWGCVDEADKRDAIAAELRALAHKAGNLVPGVMHCAKCKLRLHRTTLYMGSGTTGAGDSKTEPCPNGCGPLWPVTWEQEAREAMALVNGLHEQLQAAQQQGKPDHPEDKLGMVPEGWGIEQHSVGYMVNPPDGPGCWASGRDDFNVPLADQTLAKLCAAMLAASPAPDHSAGVGGMVVDDAAVERAAKAVADDWQSRRLKKIPWEQLVHAQRELARAQARIVIAALAQPADADADGAK